VRAIDYLLKPVSRERVAEAVRRARSGTVDQRAALTSLLKRFTIHNADRIYFVPYADVDWIEAAGNYVRLHAGDATHLLRSTMHAVEELLAGSQFVRIHRSTIVNIERIRELRPTFAGDYVVILRNDQRLTLSRTYRTVLARIASA